ncbi:hypothetical protein T03_3888 [Trichinella britovi]|uniref:Uncharacterized protein n=1 Tax=Trichinella britovi TaxID=45882 RepID=A0A0V1CEU2_TRIBR|nr:hypothetical protein T03_3888 [Trichinella britovi]
MLLATAFLPVPHVNTGVSLLEAGTTGTLAALFQYFRQEWMTDERLPLWNVHNVNIRTNNHLEGWHNRLNRKAGKSHNGFYELLELLIAEQRDWFIIKNAIKFLNAIADITKLLSRRKYAPLCYAHKHKNYPEIV